MNKTNQAEYIEYLEKRLAKLTENSTIGDQDLNALIDTQNEVVVNSASSLKTILSSGNNFANQITSMHNRIIASDLFIDYLTNSIWWKLSSPFRRISRILKNRRAFSPFDFSNPTTIESNVCTVIFANSLTGSLKNQISNLQKQKHFTNLQLLILDLSDSNDISTYAKANKLTCFRIKSINNDFDLTNLLVDKKTEYVVYLKQGTFVKNSEWLYKLVCPLTREYTNLSILYKNAKHVKQIKKNTFFNELKTRIIEIDDYGCFYLPLSRDSIQYIPHTIIDGASAIAKRYNGKA